MPKTKPLHAWTADDNAGLVYFIGGANSGPVKIGFTSKNNANKRLQSLKTASPEDLVILGTIPGSQKLEKEIHYFLFNCCIRREWFYREPALAMLNAISFQSIDREDELSSKLKEQAFKIGEVDSDGEEPLHVTVARHLLWDVSQALRDCRTDQPLPLSSWLSINTNRDDAIGDLAMDALHDEDFPLSGSLIDYLSYGMEVSGRKEVTRTIIDAWVECQQYLLLFIQGVNDRQRLSQQGLTRAMGRK